MGKNKIYKPLGLCYKKNLNKHDGIPNIVIYL